MFNHELPVSSPTVRRSGTLMTATRDGNLRLARVVNRR